MDELVSIQTITEYLENAVKTKTPLAPSVWIDAAQKMNVLLGDEHDRLYELQQKVAQAKLNFLECDPKHNVSAARLRVETTDDYKEMRKQEAKIKRIEEAIRIAKLQGKLKEAEFRGY